MDRAEAIQIALRARRPFEVPEEFSKASAEKRIIEIVIDNKPVVDALPEPGPVKDLVAWVVTLSFDASDVEFAIDDKTGKVVRFRRSRSAVAYIHQRNAAHE